MLRIGKTRKHFPNWRYSVNRSNQRVIARLITRIVVILEQKYDRQWKKSAAHHTIGNILELSNIIPYFISHNNCSNNSRQGIIMRRQSICRQRVKFNCRIWIGIYRNNNLLSWWNKLRRVSVQYLLSRAWNTIYFNDDEVIGELNINAEPPSRVQVEMTIKSLKYSKAAGMPNIQSELLKTEVI